MAPGPLDDARICKAMLEADKELTQDALAKRLGMKQSTLSEYLSLLNLPADVQEIIGRPINLTLSHLLQICRLDSQEDQAELANTAPKQGLTVKQLVSDIIAATRRKAILNRTGCSKRIALFERRMLSQIPLAPAGGEGVGEGAKRSGVGGSPEVQKIVERSTILYRVAGNS